MYTVGPSKLFFFKEARSDPSGFKKKKGSRVHLTNKKCATFDPGPLFHFKKMFKDPPPPSLPSLNIWVHSKPLPIPRIRHSKGSPIPPMHANMINARTMSRPCRVFIKAPILISFFPHFSLPEPYPSPRSLVSLSPPPTPEPLTLWPRVHKMNRRVARRVAGRGGSGEPANGSGGPESVARGRLEQNNPRAHAQ